MTYVQKHSTLPMCALRLSLNSFSAMAFRSLSFVPKVTLAPKLNYFCIPEAKTTIVSRIDGAWLELLNNAIMYLKRTFQPSLLSRKRKHGFLARVRSKNGKKIIARRLAKGRSRLTC